MKRLLMLIMMGTTICVSGQNQKAIDRTKSLKKGNSMEKVTPEFLWSLGRVSDIKVSPMEIRYCLESPIIM